MPSTVQVTWLKHAKVLETVSRLSELQHPCYVRCFHPRDGKDKHSLGHVSGLVLPPLCLAQRRFQLLV